MADDPVKAAAIGGENNMLIGFVSDEQYLALPDVLVEFQQGDETVEVVRSTPRGAVNANVPPGEYTVTLSRDGFAPKRVTLPVHAGMRHQFRLLSRRMLGYIWPKWVKSGEGAEYRIHSPEECQVSLWRYGLKKELISVVNWHGEHGPGAALQLVPDGDFTQTGVEWNRHGFGNAQLSQRIVAPERSGLYYIHLEGKSGEFFACPWVVAPSSPRAPIAILASTNTWNAYNNFGGRSNYVNCNQLPAQPTVHARADLDRYHGTGNGHSYRFPDDEYLPLSFERPEPFNHIPKNVQATDPIRGRNECHLAPAEWRLLAWAEREGYGYDLYSEQQLHDGQLDLDQYKVLILSTHPEYWTAEMYWRVKDWVFTRGGKLMYLGGNGIDAEVLYPTPTTMRVQNHFENVDSSGERRDGIYNCRFHRRVESPTNLLGVVFTDIGIMTGAPFQVLDASHWAFAGTGLSNGDLFGKHSLHERAPGGASGHELDRRDQHSPPQTHVLAEGTNPGGGAEMVHFETAGGGQVFSAGSITYGSCLLVDEPLSRVTRNVLDRFLG